MEKEIRTERVQVESEEHHECRHGRHDHHREPRETKRFHREFENTVRLFTIKEDMISYVNSLENIENVDVYKIEDNLYKVLVIRTKSPENH